MSNRIQSSPVQSSPVQSSPVQLIKLKHISPSECDFIKSLFGDKFILAKQQGVIVYGAGSAGREIADCLRLHGIRINYFCDKNTDLAGKKINGIEIIPIHTLEKKFKNEFVIIGVLNCKNEVLEFLRSKDFPNIGLIQNDEQFYYYLQFPRWHINLDSLLRDQDEICQAFNLLADDKSKTIFINRLALLSSGADFRAYKEHCELSDFPTGLPNSSKIFAHNFENEMYFRNDLVELKEGMSLVDCGAFDGDSFKEFALSMEHLGLNYSTSYCFEPDAKNFDDLERNLRPYPKVKTFKLGVWNKKDTLNFADSDVMYRTEACVVHQTDGKVVNVAGSNCSIDVDSIDNVIFPGKVDIIKMDVEGSEENAIIGAANTVRHHRPLLIISAYHKHSDLYRLPLLIDKIEPGYKIHLRQFSFSWSETVLIAKH